jgi:hypothetical protein
MPKTKISEFSATPGNNTDIDGINIAEGCAPSGINDAIRELMAQLKDFQAGTAGDSFNGPVGTSTAAAGAFTTLSATGVTTVQAGTAGAPAITTTGDTNTGIFFPAADTVAASVGGTEGLRLTSTGLGIGTSSPGTKLTVHAGADGDVGFFRGGSTRQVQIGTSSTAGYINTDNGSAGLEIRTQGTARMFVDNSGNLGLGVTPSAWEASAVLQFGSAGNTSFSYGKRGVTNNAYYDGSNWRYVYSTNAALYQMNTGQHQWYTAPSGTAGNSISFTQAMTLDASGRLLLGTTSASGGIGAGGLDVYDRIAVGTGTAGTPGLHCRDSTGTGLFFGTNVLGFSTGGSERARITSGGDLLVGGTSGDPNPGVFIYTSGAVSQGNSAGASGFEFLSFRRSGTQIGTVTQNGTTAVAYNTSSDYRLKHDIAPMTGALAKVALLKPCTYKWNADNSAGEGFIAHELAEVCPQAVTGEKDAVDADGNPKYQGIDTSFLVATLAAAIKELKAEFDAYKATHP